MRTQIYQLKKEILQQDDKKILTSCSIPNWQLFRINHIRKKLIHDIELAGCYSYIPEGKIELLALKLFIRKMNSPKQMSKRAIRYNDDKHSYSKINIRFENTSDYFLLRSKRNHLRVSVSYLMDLALRMYLHIVARILYLKLTKGKLKRKWHALVECFSNYKEITSKDNGKCLIINENSNFYFNSG